MKKRLISMLLVLVMVLGMLPATALAASSEEEALGEVNIYNGEQKLSYLSINGRIRELIYTYFNHVDANGKNEGDSCLLRQSEYNGCAADRRPPARVSNTSPRKKAATRRSWASSPTAIPPAAFRS